MPRTSKSAHVNLALPDVALDVDADDVYLCGAAGGEIRDADVTCRSGGEGADICLEAVRPGIHDAQTWKGKRIDQASNDQILVCVSCRVLVPVECRIYVCGKQRLSVCVMQGLCVCSMQSWYAMQSHSVSRRVLVCHAVLVSVPYMATSNAILMTTRALHT